MASYISGQQRSVSSSQQADRQQPIRAGQMLHGKMIKSLGNQQMEVQIGGRTLTAVLSGVITEGESKWFQVESAGPPPVLKPVKADGSGKPDVQQLLQSIGLGGNKEVKELLSSMIRQQQPVSAEKLTAAAGLLAGTSDKKEGLSVIKWMMSKEMPLKDALFQPLLSANKGVSSPLNGLLNQLTSQLQQAGPINQVMLSINKPYSNVIHDQAVQQLFEKMTSGTATEKNQSLEAMKTMQILPKSATLTNWHHSLQTPSAKQVEGMINALRAIPQTQTVQNQIVQLQEGLKALQTGDTRQLAEAVIRGQGVLQQSKPQSQLYSLQILQVPSGSTSQHPAFMQALGDVQQTIGQQSSTAIQLMLKDLIQKMGSDYEARIQNTGNPAETAQTLKAQLVSLLEMPGLTAQVRESAEQVLNRLNGMQLLSSDNGPQQQLIMQFPFELGDHQTDVMMKMNGKKKSDGSLDPEHVRVLFYITLSELKESIIDMNVQNRVVSLDIYNEHHQLDLLAKPIIPVLQSALEKAGYAFSAVKFHNTKEVDPPILNPAEDALSSIYHKVDIKI
ncbi:hypothetical protein [Jeotgalibacillus sp. JSM ZJ347]|uniref:hypothetical protein n=1 Tax=Jeotgalibacillus sp. JSM ZJ347 TaxID=3342117 RepID=UPI0035A9095D